MRRTQLAWATVICMAAAGCLPWWEHRAGEDRHSRSIEVNNSGKGVYVRSVLLERPLGDTFLTKELWASGLPAVSPESQALLDENGLRVAVLSGNLPAKFQSLLDSGTDTVNPQDMTFASRKEAVIPTAGPIDKCTYDLLPSLAAERTRLSFDRASCGILVRPELTEDGRVRIWCEPQIQHGERRELIRPTSDATSFTMEGEVPVERYPALGFDLILGPNDYLLIGWLVDRKAALGSAMFGVEAKGQSRQRLLVIRAGSTGKLKASDLPPLSRPSGHLPIAAEAGQSSK